MLYNFILSIKINVIWIIILFNNKQFYFYKIDIEYKFKHNDYLYI